MRSLRPGGGGAELTGGAKLARRCSAVPPSERHLEPAKRATAIRTRPIRLAGRGGVPSHPSGEGGPRVGRGTKRWRHSRAVLRSSVSIGVDPKARRLCRAHAGLSRTREKGRRSRRMCPAGASRFRHPRSRTGPRRRTNQTMEIPLSLAKESERRRDPAAEAGRAGRAFPGGEMK